MVQKFTNLLVLEEACTKTDSPVLRAYGLVCATRGTKPRSRSKSEIYPVTHTPVNQSENLLLDQESQMA